MAETLEKPVEEEAKVEAPILDDDDDETSIVEDFFPTEAAVEAAPEEAAKPVQETPAPIAHSPELIEQAARLMIPADEVTAMSSDELRRVIKHADRIGQVVYNSLAKKPADAEVETPKSVDELSVLDDPEKYDQEFVKPIKTILSKQAEENRVLRERLEKLENKSGQTEAQALHSRLMTVAAEVSPEVVKAFDMSTAAGKQKYGELLQIMGAVHRTNTSLPEKTLFARAVKAMELVAEKPKESPEAVGKKQAWDGGALSKPIARKSGASATDRVGDLLNEFRANARKTTPKTNGHSGN